MDHRPEGGHDSARTLLLPLTPRQNYEDMLDRRLFTDDFEATKRRLARKGVDGSRVDHVRRLLQESRSAMRLRDDRKAAAKVASKRVQQLRRLGPSLELDEAMQKANEAKLAVERSEESARLLEEELRSEMLLLPNLPSDDAPEGQDESHNVVIQESEPVAPLTERPRPHWEIGEELGILDTRRGASMSGSMFTMLRGGGAQLLRALVSFGMDLNRDRYEEIVPPHFVSTATLTGTGHLPKFTDDMYRMTNDDLWAIPTGEVPLTSMHAGEILPFVELPRRYMAYTVCWRREAGSAGRDTRGMQRLHEFHKVELLHLCARDQVEMQFKELLDDCLRPLKLLGLPYRIVDLCAGDLTFSSERIYDLEVYAAGSQKWLEVSSVGSFGDFQARRAQSRFRRGPEDRPELLNALNGSGMATPRVWAAIIENYQRSDGSIVTPEVLRKYIGKDTIGPNG